MTKKKAKGVLESTHEARQRVLQELVPLAIDTLRKLLTVDDDKVRLAASDTIMSISGVKEKKTSSDSSIQLHLSGQHIQTAIGGLDKLKEAKVRILDGKENSELPEAPAALKERRAGNGE